MNGNKAHMKSDLFLSDLDQAHMQSYGKSAAYLISEVEFLVFQVALQWTMTQAATGEICMHKTCIRIWADASIQGRLKQTNHIYGRIGSTGDEKTLSEDTHVTHVFSPWLQINKNIHLRQQRLIRECFSTNF